MSVLGEQFFTIYNMDKEFAFKLSNILQKSTDELLVELEESIINTDKEKSKRLLHTLKGSAANFGAEELTDEAHKIESAIYLLEEDNKQEYLDCLVELKKVYIKTLEELEKHK